MVYWREAAQRMRKSISTRSDLRQEDAHVTYPAQPGHHHRHAAPPSPSPGPRAAPPPGEGGPTTPPTSRVSGAFYIPNSAAQRASAYMHPDEGAALRRQLAFDALALVRQLPLAAQGYMLVRRDTSRVTSLFRSQWMQFWGELRGGMLLFFDPEAMHSSLGPHARPIQLVFSATKCILDLKNTLSYSQVKLRREDGASLLLRFREPQEAQNWCALLQTHTVPYTTVRLADFDWITAIGKGASGKVFLVRDNHTNARLALKVIDKSKVFRTQLTFQHVINERLVLEMCVGCPFLIQMRYAFQTDVHLYFATDFYDGGDVFSLLQTNKGRLSERHARRLVAEVVLALSWLHERNIVYRDLKPENVVLDGEGHIRLADFGLAKVLSWPNNQLTQTICGTTAYAAPEMLQSKPYNVTLDLWCLGVFIYHILVGRTPFNFRGRTMEEMEEMQRTRSVRYSSSLSLEAVSLIKGLLQNDPSRRPTLNQVKRHRFFADVDWVRVARKEPHPDGLAQFVADRSQKESIIAKLASSRTQMSSDNISTSTIVPSDCPEINSVALDKYLLRNINAEEWRNVSFSEDEDVSTAAEFPTVLRAKGKYMETWAIAAWAWTCRNGSRIPVQGLTSQMASRGRGRGDSGSFLTHRRSLPERVLGPRVSVDRNEYLGGNDLTGHGHGRASLQAHQEVPPPPYRNAPRRSFRRREIPDEGTGIGNPVGANDGPRNHSTGHTGAKEGRIARDTSRPESRFQREGGRPPIPTARTFKFGRVLSGQTEKRGRNIRRPSLGRRSAEYPVRPRISQDYTGMYPRRNEDPSVQVMAGDRRGGT